MAVAGVGAVGRPSVTPCAQLAAAKMSKVMPRDLDRNAIG
jgi:hypothetical protein